MWRKIGEIWTTKREVAWKDRDRKKMKCDQQEEVEKNPREGLHTSKTFSNGSLALSWAGK